MDRAKKKKKRIKQQVSEAAFRHSRALKLNANLVQVMPSMLNCSCMVSENSAVETWHRMVNVKYCKVAGWKHLHSVVCRLSELIGLSWAVHQPHAAGSLHLQQPRYTGSGLFHNVTQTIHCPL